MHPRGGNHGESRADGDRARALADRTPGGGRGHARPHRSTGAGRLKVVLLHSALGDSRLWRRQVEALRPYHEVVAPDLPGYGETPLPTEAFSYVDVVASHLPAALVGNSFGGAVALRTALAHPKQVSKLVLVGAGYPTWDWTQEMRDYWDAENEAWERGDFDAAVEINMRFWVDPAFHDEVGPQQRRAFELQSAHEEPELRWPELKPLKSLQMPTLVVVGANDKPDFQKIAEHFAEEIPDADLVIVPGAGHLVGVEQPEELNALLLEFLED